MLRERLQQQFWNERDWLTSRRWFGDKARPVVAVDVLVADEVKTDQHDLILTLVECTHEWGPSTTYFVPITAGEGPFSDRDATICPDLLTWFVAGFAENRIVQGQGTWQWREIGTDLPDLASLSPESVRLISAEQSNSSFICGDRAISKLFRKVQSGINPDLEIGEHLMRVGGFQHAAALFGVIELELDGKCIDIAAVQEFVPNQGDGWSWLLAELGQSDRRDFLIEQIRLLGRRTGELHLAMSDSAGDPAFAPLVVSEDDAQAIIRRVIAEMEGSVEGLTHHLPPDELEQLHKNLGTMMGDAWSMVGTLLIRVHGDYHLGQTLRTLDDDFVIIDFEGEPGRPMDERRQKLPALKDVAGMLRSLDYAGAMLMQQSANEQEKTEIVAWLKSASDAFVSAWRSAVSVSDLALAPANDEAFASVLNLMIAEKALYELRYEMNNRPDWLWIPLGALLRLTGTEEVG